MSEGMWSPISSVGSELEEEKGEFGVGGREEGEVEQTLRRG
jgi:hypothetical protein